MGATVVQCRMVATSGPSAVYTAWLPKRFAEEGRRLFIDGVGEFTVDECGTELPEAYVRERSRDYLRTRKASDI